MSVRTPGIVLQARFASQRLPGKALAPIEGRTMLSLCLERLLASDAAAVVLATTTRGDDDPLAQEAARLGVPVFRGSEEDVLDRFAQCAAYFGFDDVIRATADNPCVDLDAPRRLLSALRDSNADYASEEGLPYGAAVEAVTQAALRRASGTARDGFDREHVTTFVKRRRDLFRLDHRVAPALLARPDVRLTVDTTQDLQHVRALYAYAGRAMPSLAEFIAASDALSQEEVA